MEELSAEKVVEILKGYGTFVTVEEANKILEFMNELANITLDQIFGK